MIHTDNPAARALGYASVIRKRVAKRLRRRLAIDWPRTLRALTRGEQESVQRALAWTLAANTRTISNDGWNREVIKHLIHRAAGHIDHYTATTRIHDLSTCAQPSRLTVRGWLELEHVAGAVGLFAASAGFRNQAFRRIEHAAAKSDRWLVASILALLYERDVEAAQSRWKVLTAKVGHTAAHHREPQLGRYLRLLQGTGEPDPRRHYRSDAYKEWLQAVANRRVMIYGPAPTSGYQASALNTGPVARFMAPGITEWAATDDYARGRTDIVYINLATLRWLKTLTPSQRTALLAHYQTVIFKNSSIHWRTWGLQVSSRGESHPPALVEPDVNLATQPAPVTQRCTGARAASGRTGLVGISRSWPGT